MVTMERAGEIAAELNTAAAGSLNGGQLVYTADGDGGEWYGAGDYGFGPATVALAVRRGWTPEEVCERFNRPTAEGE